MADRPVDQPTKKRPYRVEGKCRPSRTYGSLTAAYGRALEDTISGRIGTHVTIHAPGIVYSFERLEGRRVVVRFTRLGIDCG